MSTDPFFSIVTATYNVGDTIDIAASSIRAQHREDVEFIIVDGASTDDTMRHVERNADVVTKVISEPDHGIYDALNKGVRAARGQLIGILGADDSYFSGALDTVADYHRRAPADIYAGQTLLTSAEGRGTLRKDEPYGLSALVSGIPFGHNAMFATRSAYERVGAYDTDYRICADAQWVHRALRAGLTCTRVPRLLVQFAPSGVSTTSTDLILRESALTIQENFPFLTEDEARTLLFVVREWSDPKSLLPILRRHADDDLRLSLASAFERRRDVWEELLRAHGSSSGAVSRLPVAAEKAARMARCEAPIFSIIIPAYNVERYIGRCLESILSQPFLEIEVIVVDDGSTDGTSSIVESYAKRDGRLVHLKQANAGQGAARARAISQARGEYIWCVDSDDRIQARVLHKILGTLTQTCADIVVLNYAEEHENGKIEYPALIPSWLAGRLVEPLADEKTFSAVSGWNCPPWRYVIRRLFLEERGIKFHAGLFYEDHPFAIDMMLAASQVYVDSSISYFYLRRDGSTARSKDRRAFDFLKIRRIVLDRFHEKGLIKRFPELVASYVFPINFIRAHVAKSDWPDFLTEMARDTRADELEAVRAYGGVGELELLRSYEKGRIENADLLSIEGTADRSGKALGISRTLSAADVTGLAGLEGPYPEMGVGQAIRWMDGNAFRLRLRTADIEKPVLRIRYRNVATGQFLLVEQNQQLIELFPCRAVGIEQVGEIDVPVMPGEKVVEILISVKETVEFDGRRSGIALEGLDLEEAPARNGAHDAAAERVGTDRLVIGDGTRADHVVVDVRVDVEPRTYVQIGRDSDVAGRFVFERGIGKITIGDRSSVGGGSLLICTQEGGIEIGNNVMLSWNVTVIDTNAHSLDPDVRANDAYDWLIGEKTGRRGLYKDWANVKSAPVVIGDSAWVGFGSSIMKGVTIGRGAVIGSNSVVTKDVPDYAIVAGNPARHVGYVPGYERQAGRPGSPDRLVNLGQ